MVNSIILRGPGTNCDKETAFAFSKAGAKVENIYIDKFLEYPEKLMNYNILAIPGGFTYGDDLGAGTVMAARLSKIKTVMKNFVYEGNLIIGICNGFQILLKMGLLPGLKDVNLTLSVIDGARFRDQWLDLEVISDKCVFTEGLSSIHIPMANSEGRLVINELDSLKMLEKEGCIALKYRGIDPTGSDYKIAGICDKTGRILGLMPHPERNIFRHSPPGWQEDIDGGEGIKIFENAVDYFS